MSISHHDSPTLNTALETIPVNFRKRIITTYLEIKLCGISIQFIL